MRAAEQTYQGAQDGEYRRLTAAALFRDAAIGLLDLATQHSGLPRMPDNFAPAEESNPYADYHAANMYAFLAKHGVAKPGNAPFLYSNYGFGLLGQALSNRAGEPYPQLLKDEVLDPLGMHDTTVALSPEQQARFLPGHTGVHRPAHAWDLDAFAGAGAIRSTSSAACRPEYWADSVVGKRPNTVAASKTAPPLTARSRVVRSRRKHAASRTITSGAPEAQIPGPPRK